MRVRNKSLILIILLISIIGYGIADDSGGFTIEIQDGNIISSIERSLLPVFSSDSDIIALYAGQGLDCAGSQLVGWTSVPGKTVESNEVRIISPLPVYMKPGDHSFSLVLFSKNVHDPCKNKVSGPVTIKISGEENNHTILDNNSALSNGPVLEVLMVELPVMESTTAPGGAIHPVITLANTGEDDPDEKEVEIAGYLMHTQLIPVSAKIPSIKAGQTAKHSLSYRIPDYLEYGVYTLSLMVDPNRLIPTRSGDTNSKKAGGMVSIVSPEDDSFIGCEECWAGYR